MGRDAVQLVVGIGHLAAVAAVVLDLRHTVIGIVGVFGFLGFGRRCFREAPDTVLDVIADERAVLEVSVSAPLFALRREVGKVVDVPDRAAVTGVRCDFTNSHISVC